MVTMEISMLTLETSRVPWKLLGLPWKLLGLPWKLLGLLLEFLCPKPINHYYFCRYSSIISWIFLGQHKSFRKTYSKCYQKQFQKPCCTRSAKSGCLFSAIHFIELEDPKPPLMLVHLPSAIVHMDQSASLSPCLRSQAAPKSRSCPGITKRSAAQNMFIFQVPRVPTNQCLIICAYNINTVPTHPLNA